MLRPASHPRPAGDDRDAHVAARRANRASRWAMQGRTPRSVRSAHTVLGSTDAIAAAANMASSVEDPAKDVAFHLTDYASAAGPVLKGTSLRDMHRPQWLLDDWQNAWGFGVRVRRLRRRRPGRPSGLDVRLPQPDRIRPDAAPGRRRPRQRRGRHAVRLRRLRAAAPESDRHEVHGPHSHAAAGRSGDLRRSIPHAERHRGHADRAADGQLSLLLPTANCTPAGWCSSRPRIHVRSSSGRSARWPTTPWASA